MSEQHYQFGRTNGCVPLGAEYGSEAWNDAMRGAQDAQAAEAERTRRAAENYAPLPSRSPAAGGNGAALAPLVFVLVAGYFVWTAINSWASYPAPYSWVARYYYLLVALPIKGFAPVWSYCAGEGTVGRIALAVAGVVAYGFGLLVAIAAAAQLLRKKLFLVVLGPAGFALAWWLIHAVFHWATK